MPGGGLSSERQGVGPFHAPNCIDIQCTLRYFTLVCLVYERGENELLKAERGVSFEEVAEELAAGRFIGPEDNPVHFERRERKAEYEWNTSSRGCAPRCR
jgi:hypothetical protein